MNDSVFKTLSSSSKDYEFSNELVTMIKYEPNKPESIFIQKKLCLLFNFRSSDFHLELSRLNPCQFNSQSCREYYEWVQSVAPKMTDLEIIHQYNFLENPSSFKRNINYLFINRQNIKDTIFPYLEFYQNYQNSFGMDFLDLCIRCLYKKTHTGFNVHTEPEKNIHKIVQELEQFLFRDPLADAIYTIFFRDRDEYSLSDFVYSSVFCRLINVRTLILNLYGQKSREYKISGLLEKHLCDYFSEKLDGKTYINRYEYMLEMIDIMSGNKLNYINRMIKNIENRTGTLLMSTFVDILGWHIQEKNWDKITIIISKNMDMVYKAQKDRRCSTFLSIAVSQYFKTNRPWKRDAVGTLYYKLLLDFNNTFILTRNKEFTDPRFTQFAILLVDKPFLKKYQDCPICFESFEKNQYIFSCLVCQDSKVHLKCGIDSCGSYRCCLCRKFCNQFYLRLSWDKILCVN